MPLISVILPAYNASCTLSRAVDSILSQTYRDFELLIVDDGSMDATGRIADSYADKDARIQVFHKTNGGANSARNMALDHIHGEYVTFCDADDYADDNWLQSFADNLEDNDVVIQGWKYVRSNIETIYYENTPKDSARAADVMSQMESFGFLVTKCFRTDIIRNNSLRFNERYRFLEDEEFVCHYWTFVRKLKFVHTSAYNYVVPNFNKKYTALDNYGLYVLLVNHASRFINYTDSFTMRKYCMGLFRNMLLSFQQHRFKDACIRLKEFAQYGRKYDVYNKYMKWIRLWNWRVWCVSLFFRYLFVPHQ